MSGARKFNSVVHNLFKLHLSSIAFLNLTAPQLKTPNNGITSYFCALDIRDGMWGGYCAETRSGMGGSSLICHSMGSPRDWRLAVGTQGRVHQVSLSHPPPLTLLELLVISCKSCNLAVAMEVLIKYLLLHRSKGRGELDYKGESWLWPGSLSVPLELMASAWAQAEHRPLLSVHQPSLPFQCLSSVCPVYPAVAW